MRGNATAKFDTVINKAGSDRTRASGDNPIEYRDNPNEYLVLFPTCDLYRNGRAGAADYFCSFRTSKARL